MRISGYWEFVKLSIDVNGLSIKISFMVLLVLSLIQCNAIRGFHIPLPIGHCISLPCVKANTSNGRV